MTCSEEQGHATYHCAATHCNTLQHTAAHCNKTQVKALQEEACKSTINPLRKTRICCITLQHATTLCHSLQHASAKQGQISERGVQERNLPPQNNENTQLTTTLQHTATHSNNALHHTATNCNQTGEGSAARGV